MAKLCPRLGKDCCEAITGSEPKRWSGVAERTDIMDMAQLSKVRISRGCFFCKSGKEADVINHFKITFPNGEALSPTRIRIRRIHDVAIEERVPLLPGYVFFQFTEEVIPASGINDLLLQTLSEFSKIDSVLKLLKYTDGTWKLCGSDDLFAQMLFKTDGNIGLSTAYYDKGNRIRVLDGFLKDYQGNITNVNRKKRTVEVTVNLQGKKVIMWLGYELVEALENQSRIIKERT